MDKFKRLTRVTDSLQKVKDNWWGNVPNDIYDSNEEFAKKVETLVRQTMQELDPEIDEDILNDAWLWNPDFLDGGDEAHLDFLDQQEADIIVPKIFELLKDYPQIGYNDLRDENNPGLLDFYVKEEYFNPDEDE